MKIIKYSPLILGLLTHNVDAKENNQSILISNDFNIITRDSVNSRQDSIRTRADSLAQLRTRADSLVAADSLSRRRQIADSLARENNLNQLQVSADSLNQEYNKTRNVADSLQNLYILTRNTADSLDRAYQSIRARQDSLASKLPSAINKANNLFNLYNQAKSKLDSLRRVMGREIPLEELTLNPFSFGIGYQFSDPALYLANMNLNIKNFLLGLEFGYGEKTTASPDKVIFSENQATGYSTNGIEKNLEENIVMDYGINFGYDFGKISAIINPGAQNTKIRKTKEVEEYLKRNGTIVASNKDNYAEDSKRTDFRVGLGANVNFGRFSLGLIGKIGKKYVPNYGLRINYRF
jgi:hypothetical protein